MLCLTVTRILPTVFAIPLANPNTILEYDATKYPNLPRVNDVCLGLYEKSQDPANFALNEYQCFCIEADDKTKAFFENLHTEISWLKERNDPIIQKFKVAFFSVLKYLQTEFKIQEPILKFIDGETGESPVVEDLPISVFVINNIDLPIDQFYTEYSAFLMNHLLEKFENEFAKLNFFDIQTLLKNEFGFIDCNGRISYEDFATISEVIRSINESVSGMVKGMIVAAS